MRISENGLNLIKSFEGCRLTAYKCPAGVWTIGSYWRRESRSEDHAGRSGSDACI